MGEDEDLVSQLCAIERGLTDWEVEFVESVSGQVLDDHTPLTDRQRAKANEILERCSK